MDSTRGSLHSIAWGASAEAVRWTELVERVSAAARMLRREIVQHAAQLGLNEAQLSVLWACAKVHPAGVGQSELAAALAFSPAHVSGVVEQLRRQALVEPERAPEDRRRQLWRLGPAGQTKVEQFLKHLVEVVVAHDGAGIDPALEGAIRLIVDFAHRPQRGGELSLPGEKAA